MTDIVEVLIPVEGTVAGARADPGKREAIGRPVSQILQPQLGDDPLLAAAQRLSADAKDRGLTEVPPEAELAADKRERTR